MQESAATGAPDSGDRTGRRPLADRGRLRSALERSTGITPQALAHLPGLVVGILDRGYRAIELSSTVPQLADAWIAERRSG